MVVVGVVVVVVVVVARAGAAVHVSERQDDRRGRAEVHCDTVRARPHAPRLRDLTSACSFAHVLVTQVWVHRRGRVRDRGAGGQGARANLHERSLYVNL